MGDINLILSISQRETVVTGWLHRYWWRMLKTKCVSDKFEILVTDSECWWPIWYIDKINDITKKVANIMILPPTSEISHHHKVTNITMSPTALKPRRLHRCWWRTLETIFTVIIKMSPTWNCHQHHCRERVRWSGCREGWPGSYFWSWNEMKSTVIILEW